MCVVIFFGVHLDLFLWWSNCGWVLEFVIPAFVFCISQLWYSDFNATFEGIFSFEMMHLEDVFLSFAFVSSVIILWIQVIFWTGIFLEFTLGRFHFYGWMLRCCDLDELLWVFVLIFLSWCFQLPNLISYMVVVWM